MNTPRTGAASAVLEGKVYVLGGEDQFGDVLDTVVRYDPQTDQWEAFPPMRTARVFAAALAVEGQLFVIGGRDGAGNVLDDVEIYDLARGRWEPFPHILEARQGLAAVLRDSSLFVAGGSNAQDQLLASIEVYTHPFSGDSNGMWNPFEESNAEEVEVTGVITALDAMSLTVDTLTFTVTAATVIIDDDGATITLGDLAVGVTVDVNGVRDVTGALFATRIEVEDDNMGGLSELEFCASGIALNVGDQVNIRDYVQVKDGSSSVDWAQVFFTYTQAGADDPTVPPDWNLGAFDAGQPVTIVAADTAAGTGNQGQGEYRVYVVRQGQPMFDDHVTFRIDDERDSEVEEAKCENNQAARKRGGVQELGTPRAGLAAVTMDGRVLFLGGFGEFGPLDLVQQLSVNDRLRDLTPLPTARGGLSAGVLGDSVVVIGGRDGSDRVLADVLVLNPVSEAWEPMPRLNTARESSASAVVDGAVYVFGGRDANGRVLASVEAFGAEPPASVAVDDEPSTFDFRLDQNYPNPFRAGTTIRFSVFAATPGRRVTLAVYDVQGRRVALLVDKVLGPGRHEVTWDGRGRNGMPVGSGIYIYRLQQGPLEARKMMAIIH